MKQLLLLIIIPFLSFGQTNCSDSLACNFNEPEPCDFYACIDCLDYSVPDLYDFQRDGESSVAFAGQTCRLRQALLIHTQLMNPEEYGPPILTQGVYDGVFPEEFELENCGKKIGQMIAQTPYSNIDAGESAAVQGMFMDYIISDWEVFCETEAYQNSAYEGVEGMIVESDGAIRYVNEKGLELKEVFSKGLIGAMCLDQITHKYTHPNYLELQDNYIVTGDEEYNYTDMEHKWDEGFGYVFGLEDDPMQIQTADFNYGVLLGKYLSMANENFFPGIINAVYDAFILGRAAIVANDYDTRNSQHAIIKNLLDKVVVAYAINYLEIAVYELGQPDLSIENTFHSLSKAYGFILSLPFTSYFSYNDVQTMLDQMSDGNGFWDITPEELIDLITYIETESNFSPCAYSNLPLIDLYECDELYCSQLNVDDVVTDDVNMTIDIAVYDGNESGASYPHIAYTIDAFGDTIQTGNINSFGNLGLDTSWYSYSLNSLPNYPLNIYYVYGMDSDTCVLTYTSTSTAIEEPSVKKKIITTIDILGRETNNKGFQLHIYDDGSVEKKYLIK